MGKCQFTSVATNLVSPATTNTQAFRKDLVTGQVILVSKNSAGVEANGGSTSSFNTIVAVMQQGTDMEQWHSRRRKPSALISLLVSFMLLVSVAGFAGVARAASGKAVLI